MHFLLSTSSKGNCLTSCQCYYVTLKFEFEMWNCTQGSKPLRWHIDFYTKLPLLVSKGCHNKIPQTGPLIIIEMFVWKSVNRATLPLETLGEKKNVPCFSLSFWLLQAFLCLYMHHSSFLSLHDSPCLSTHHSPLVCACPNFLIL